MKRRSPAFAAFAAAALTLTGCGNPSDSSIEPNMNIDPKPAQVGDTVQTCSRNDCKGSFTVEQMTNGGDCFHPDIVIGIPAGFQFIQVRGTWKHLGTIPYNRAEIIDIKAYDASGAEVAVIPNDDVFSCSPEHPYMKDDANVTPEDDFKMARAFLVPETAATVEIGAGLFSIADLPPAPGNPILPEEELIGFSTFDPVQEPRPMDGEVRSCSQFRDRYGLTTLTDGQNAWTQNCFDRHVEMWGPPQ